MAKVMIPSYYQTRISHDNNTNNNNNNNNIDNEKNNKNKNKKTIITIPIDTITRIWMDYDIGTDILEDAMILLNQSMEDMENNNGMHNNNNMDMNNNMNNNNNNMDIEMERIMEYIHSSHVTRIN